MVRYKMLGRDVDAQPVQYRTWVVSGAPDFTGALYTGDKSGPTPLMDVSAYAIFDPTEPCDFNLPNVLDWNPTYKTLPALICDGQLAVIDGYIYLFGGQNSAKIYRATTNNPADFQDTGATLPTALCGSQLAIINGTVYLFGGAPTASLTSGTSAIYSAPVSNPLSWTNNGNLLPAALHHSQLAVIGNNIYLFGGKASNQIVSNIYTALVSNPLSWSDTGHTLPLAVYGSQLGIMDGYAFLLGGITPSGETNAILSALTVSPTTWAQTGMLPHPVSYGQFCTIGASGYLFTSTNGGPSGFTKILTCGLNAPNSWADTGVDITGTLSQSHLAVIYDRIWLYGGNGNTIILSNGSILKYTLNNVAAIQYGEVTRTQVQAAPSYLSLFQVLGFAPWKTDYGS